MPEGAQTGEQAEGGGRSRESQGWQIFIETSINGKERGVWVSTLPCCSEDDGFTVPVSVLGSPLLLTNIPGYI